MSGAAIFGTASNVISAGQSIASLFFGAGENPVTLGDLILQSWEVPETIPWGGSQKLTVHRLPGGERVIDAMGRDDHDLTWSGIILSTDASDRADAFDQLRISAKVVPLIFLGRNYSVIVSDFKADQRKVNYVPYSITCMVLTDDTGEDLGGDAEPSLLDSVKNDINTALGFNLSDKLAQLQTTIQQVQTPLIVLTGLVAGGPAAASLASGLSVVSLGATGLQQSLDGNIQGIASLAGAAGNLTGSSTTAGAVSNIGTLTALSASAANLATVNGYIGRAATNVGA